MNEKEKFYQNAPNRKAADIDHLLVHGTEADLNFNIFLQPNDEKLADRIWAYKGLIHK